ncbi:hypothetical protein CCR94_11375 [Rhodoblastus sphagnicola]|uniref:Autotransporter domain-containing protein n=1 Tax=Rhodoblastus sphagnicola TaxID=333368 RepID=A0A2S6N7T1_9HYPH|nr:autotransporter-associated beta strand repeat-containing protein [Rhodoblastus sphagnicola]MBB4197877.1 autotransporter-associated beta strand protein [Rhodoblastus sphagnicola]PPQ30666.1 hypothetical protein CCR94_11375 [Rhodoblastus sphagnicola]
MTKCSIAAHRRRTISRALLLAGTALAVAPCVVQAETLDLAGGNTTKTSLGAYPAGVTNTSSTAAVLTIDNSADETYSGTIANGVGRVALIKTGAGALTLTGVNTQTGDAGYAYGNGTSLGASLAVTDGKLIIGRGDALGGGIVAIGNATLASQGGGPVTITNTILVGVNAAEAATFDTSGGDIIVNHFMEGYQIPGNDAASDAGVIKTGSGTLYLSEDNYFNGGVQIEQGTVAINSANGLGTPRRQTNGSLSGLPVVTISAGATLETMADYTPDSVHWGNGWRAPVQLGSDPTCTHDCGFANIAPDSGTTVEINSDVTGAAGLNMGGVGTLYLAGAKSYTGGTRISSGTLEINDATATNASTLAIANGGRLTLMMDGLSLSPTAFTLSGQGIVDTNGFGAVIATAIRDGASQGSFVKAGAGVLTLAAAATYTGSTEVAGGTLSLGLDGALSTQTRVTVDAGATLDLGGHSLVIAGVSGSGTISGSASSGNGALTVGGDGSSSTFAGLLTDGLGRLALTKAGAGTLTLTGDNLYAGTTTISAGVLRIGAGGASGTLGSGAVVDNASLVFDRSDAITVAQAISGTGSLTQAGAGKLTLTGANAYSGGTFVDAGALAISSAQSLGSGSLHLADATTLNLLSSMVVSNKIVFSGAGDPTIDTGASTVTLSGVISGSGALTKLGTGALVLTGADTYTGATTVAQGMLEVDGSIVSSTTVQNGATLRGVGAVGAIAVSSGGALAPGNAAQPYGTLHSTGNVTFASGSTYAVSVGPSGSSLLTTTGSASLAGKVAATWAGAATTAGSRYTILTASGGVSGVFSSLTVTGLTTSLPVLAYDSKDVYLVFNGLTSGAVTSSFNKLAGDRIGALITNGVLASVLGGINEQINCDNCVSTFGSVGSLSAGMHGRLTLSDNFALLGGAAYSQYHSGGVEVTGAPIFLGALRYDKTEWGASRPFGEIGASASPWQRARFNRAYDDAGVARGGSGIADVATYSAFAKLGWIYRWSPIDEAAAWAGLSRSWQIVGGYVESVAGNPSPATVAGGTDRLNVVRVGAQWTHLFGGALETQISLAAAQSFDAQSGLSGDVLGLSGIHSTLGDYHWAEYGLRVGYRFADNAVVDVFADGTLGARPVGDTIHGGAGLRWAF